MKQKDINEAMIEIHNCKLFKTFIQDSSEYRILFEDKCKTCDNRGLCLTEIAINRRK
jgi:hypothetical protein